MGPSHSSSGALLLSSWESSRYFPKRKVRSAEDHATGKQKEGWAREASRTRERVEELRIPTGTGLADVHRQTGRDLGFVGGDGAGKTTAVRIGVGVLAPDQGQVLWGEAPVGRLESARFGYMPEERGAVSQDSCRICCSC
ncbi:ATP-binding cassette domain-containing protein [Streptomyces sp. NPDC056309]|uniref:ATP-binding cassette domain-containing protein n=1 Tax=unclassified Streptomyces TaxID=2593676 RepID=UPI0035D69E12